VPSKQRTKVRPLGRFGLAVLGSVFTWPAVLGSEIHSRLCWKGGLQVKHASIAGPKRPLSVSMATGPGIGTSDSSGGVSSRVVVDMLGGEGNEGNAEAYKTCGEDDSLHCKYRERVNF
jgi:hypothetical protein